MNLNVLVVEDDDALRSVISESISNEGYQVDDVGSAEDALKELRRDKYGLVLTDVNLPGKNGLELVSDCRKISPDTRVIVMTGFATIDTAVEAMKLGASDFLCKPVSLDDLLTAVKALEKKTPPQPETAGIKERPIIAVSDRMIELLNTLATLAPYNINVLITGETGTGKELFAREIHSLSGRSKRRFVALNCAAVPENLLEDELFGHVKGAFTDADSDRKGRFETADGGTLFLDEIGNMGLPLQSKLLRVLQEREFERLGSTETISVDVRVLAATSANLQERIDDGSFRSDLFHRLNVVNLQIPPLRHRREDIKPISEGLLKRFCSESGLPDMEISEEAHAVLAAYPYPGNVRQLQNFVERAAVFCGGDGEIEVDHLPDEVRKPDLRASAENIVRELPDEGIDLSKVVADVERELIGQTLQITGGNKKKAAELLNMNRTTLVEKLKRLEAGEGPDETRPPPSASR